MLATTPLARCALGTFAALAALRAKKAQANNNLAGAVWENSISEEMSAVVARYDVRIRGLREEIRRLEGEREALRAGARRLGW